MIIVMMKTITLIAIGMMVLVVIIMPLNGIFFVLLVNVLIPMLVLLRLQLLLQIVMTNGSPKSVKKRRSRKNATRKKSKRTVKKPVTCARQDFVYM